MMWWKLMSTFIQLNAITIFKRVMFMCLQYMGLFVFSSCISLWLFLTICEPPSLHHQNGHMNHKPVAWGRVMKLWYALYVWLCSYRHGLHRVIFMNIDELQIQNWTKQWTHILFFVLLLLMGQTHLRKYFTSTFNCDILIHDSILCQSAK